MTDTAKSCLGIFGLVAILGLLAATTIMWGSDIDDPGYLSGQR